MIRYLALSAIVFAMAICADVRAEDRILKTRVEPVDVEIFIPKEAKRIQGLVVHVFNYKLKTHDRWATLCRQRKWAHVNTIISRKANNRPKRIRHALKVALAEFAEKSGHPELIHVPRAGTGFSAGGMVTRVLESEPEKMLTNAISCSWVRDPNEMKEVAAVPELVISGAVPDGFKMLPAIPKFFEPAIAQKRPWGLGLQHKCKHDWANSGTLSVQWIQSIADLRYPENPDVRKPIPLRDIKFADGWLGDRTTINGTYATVAPVAEYKGDPAKATWFPDRATAFVWRAWQCKDSPVDLTAQTKDGSHKLPAFQPRKSFGLSVPPGKDLVLGVSPKKKTELKSVRFFHGDTLLGTAKAAPWQITWDAPKVGCYAIWAEYIGQNKTAVTNPALICIEPKK